MQIKAQPNPTQKTLSTLVSTLALGIVALTLFHSIKQINEANLHRDFATGALAKDINELRLVAVEYIVSQPERAKQPCGQKYASLSKHRFGTKLVNSYHS
jgi:hypothetical protein